MVFFLPAFVITSPSSCEQARAKQLSLPQQTHSLNFWHTKLALKLSTSFPFFTLILYRPIQLLTKCNFRTITVFAHNLN